VRVCNKSAFVEKAEQVFLFGLKCILLSQTTTSNIDGKLVTRKIKQKGGMRDES